MKLSQLLILSLISLGLQAQKASKDWYHEDAANGYNGTSAKKAYHELLKDKKGQTVVVAIIDSGVDIEHEDLQGNIWTNPGEKPGNGIDDDKNGYIDDVHGWNFIGGPDGKNVGPETYEATRLYAKYRYKFDKVTDPKKLNKKDKAQYDLFLKWKNDVESNRASAEAELSQISAVEANALKGMNKLAKAIEGREEGFALMKDSDCLKKLNLESDQEAFIAFNIGKQLMAQADDIESMEDLKKFLINVLEEEKQGSKNKVMYAYNPDYDSRKEIVKDNYDDQYQKNYGNNDVEGPDALHGTHVAGIVGAIVNNGIGSDGIAQNVKLMSVRAVPDGDERDKDVANAIRYAVDNGASIINMSFGKGYSWDKKVVNDAVEYAAKKDVLLVHAAGNSAQDNDATDNFPNDNLGKKGFLFKKVKYAKNWLEIGALSPKPGEDMVATFSNYGKKGVDVFSPGVQIYATVPNNEYQYLQGTSMASPVAAGVAAVIRSQYPSLTAIQVKDIIMKSAKPLTDKVKKPGSSDKVSFSDLSVTGGTVNLYNALKLAEQTKGTKKIKEKGV
jgi:cell wall-associated protease